MTNFLSEALLHAIFSPHFFWKFSLRETFPIVTKKRYIHVCHTELGKTHLCIHFVSQKPFLLSIESTIEKSLEVKLQ